jgi:hypothetical protein
MAEVNADEGEVALGLLRLLFQALDPARHLIELGHAERARVGHPGQHDLGLGPRRGELLDQAGDPADDEVVTEVHHEVVVAEELPGDQDRVREAEGCQLPDVGDLDAELRAVAHGRLDRGRGVADDDPHVGHPRLRDRLESVEQHRLVRHRDQLLG